MKKSNYNNIDNNGLIYILEELKTRAADTLKSANIYTDDNIGEVVQTVDGAVKFVKAAGGNGIQNMYDDFEFSDFENVTSEIYYAKHEAITNATIDNSTAYHGNNSLKLTYNGTALGSAVTPLRLGNEMNDYGCVKIEQGKKYILSCYVKADTNRPAFMIDIQGHSIPDSTTGGLYLSKFDPRQLPGSSNLVGLTTEWQRAICAFEVSNSAEDLYISPVPLIWGKPNSCPEKFTIWVDCIQLEEVESISNKPRDFMIGKETVIDGGSILTDTITADKIKTDAIKSRNYKDGETGSFLDLSNGSFKSKNLNWDSKGNIKATGAILKNCSFENGDDAIGLKIYTYDNLWKIRSVAEEVWAYFDPAGIRITSPNSSFVYAGLTEEGVKENGKLLKDIYAEKGHTHWYIVSGSNIVGVGSNANRLCDYSNTDSSGAKLRDNTLKLGDSSARWTRVYAASATISTSDERLKTDINNLEEKYEKFFELLRPVAYRWKGEGHDRIHTGFISQEVKNAMDETQISPLEFGAYCYDNFTSDPEWDKEATDGMEDRYSLAYEEFIALNTHMIQKALGEIKELKQENEKMKKKLENIEKNLS